MSCIMQQTFDVIIYPYLIQSDSIYLECAPYTLGKGIGARTKGWVSHINIPPGVGRLAP